VRTLLLSLVAVLSALSSRTAMGAESGYTPAMHGQVVGYRLAGIEPDGDPLDQVVLKTALGASHGMPGLHLIIDAYLENFKPDTTPILPDLLHPKQTAHNLGGFLQGKALITDDAGQVLYIGSFIAEAFLDSTNHAVMRLYGSGAAYQSGGTLKGTFTLHRDASLDGSFTGHIPLPGPALRQVRRDQGKPMKAIRKIISVVTVHPGYMVGKATTRSSSKPLKTGYGSTSSSHSAYKPPSTPSSPSSPPLRSLLTIAAGVGAVICLALGLFLFWQDRRTSQETV
jgi:hypothetical protein